MKPRWTREEPIGVLTRVNSGCCPAADDGNGVGADDSGMTKTTATALLLSVSLATGLIGAPAAASPPRPELVWGPCPDFYAQDPTLQCATMPVPIDWDNPKAGTIDLALTRREATDPAARIGSLVFNPGGPGADGRSAIFRRRPDFGSEVERRFDIVTFDPRGAGASHPIMCSGALLNSEPSPLLNSQTDFDAWLEYNRRVRQDCRRRTGPLFDHVDTVSVVKDLDALRAVLGEQRLTYYGESYGTLIGQQYAELFPGRVRALNLDGNMDHSLDTAREFVTTGAVTIQDSFDEFAAWSDRTPSSPLHGRDVHALFDSVLARAESGRLVCECGPSLTLNPWHVSEFTRAMLYIPSWRPLGNTLAAFDAGTTPPDFWVGEFFTFLIGPRYPTEPEAVPDAHRAILCSDYHLPIRDFRDYQRIRRDATALGPNLRYLFPDALVLRCLGRPTPLPNPQHRLKVRGSATPLLLVNPVHDNATGYNWATSAAKQLGKEAVLLTYDGWGHIAHYSSECIRAATTAYLLSLTLPAPGTHCPAVDPETIGLSFSIELMQRLR